MGDLQEEATSELRLVGCEELARRNESPGQPNQGSAGCTASGEAEWWVVGLEGKAEAKMWMTCNDRGQETSSVKNQMVHF